jgi:hypothetical protein
MNTARLLRVVLFGAAFAVSAAEQTVPAPGSEAKQTDTPAAYAPPHSSSPDKTQPVPSSTTEVVQKIVAPEPRYPAHPPVKDTARAKATTPTTPAKIVMATPPPPRRAETTPTTPKPGYVWVPGNYVPVDGEWRWVAGEWGVPATPVSVWIEARYDPATKTWTPGYWQPDRPDPVEPAPIKD